LFKDSEGPIPSDLSSLYRQYGIDPKRGADVFWMVQLMESWFLADPGTLGEYYGKDFSSKAIGSTRNVERIEKALVLQRLKHATKRTQKREYSKVAHAPELPARIDPGLVRSRAENCKTLFESVIAN
jgi:hypothetical protein